MSLKIPLTTEQLELIQNRLTNNEEEEKVLRVQQKKDSDSVSGWDFVELDNERCTLNELLETKVLDLDKHT